VCVCMHECMYVYTDVCSKYAYMAENVCVCVNVRACV
jgi:hypothetical protein